jgi:hypothetical protein
MNYYALTENMVWSLGERASREHAVDYAVYQFNIHQAPHGYLIANKAELEELIRLGNKRLEAEGVF